LDGLSFNEQPKIASASRIQMYCKTEWQSDYIDSFIESPMTARSLRAHN